MEEEKITQPNEIKLEELFYSEPLNEEQIKEVENNLHGFVKALFQIDQRLKNKQKENGTEN